MYSFNPRMILSQGQPDGPKPKCYLNRASLPSYIDNSHPPTKKEPFRTVLDQQYSHNLTLLVPASTAQEAFHDKITSTDDGILRYARVYMKPTDLITGSFFNSYIKTGNIVMLSEGRCGTDNVISLAHGILRIEVDKPTFEKMGIEGKPASGEGKKHVKSRFLIELNLRLPSMFPGKKAFDRLLWAFKNVLNASLAWLFYDLRSPIIVDGKVQGALAAHSPTIKVVEPRPEKLQRIMCPEFTEADSPAQDEEDEAAELLEWLSLTMSRSPRVQKGDIVDPYLCRYRPAESSEPTDLVLYQWRGFAPSAFVQTILLAAMKTSTENGWFALNGSSFDGKGYMVLRNGTEVMTWNYAD